MFTKRHEQELVEIKSLTYELGERFREVQEQLERIKQNQDQLAAQAQQPARDQPPAQGQPAAQDQRATAGQRKARGKAKARAQQRPTAAPTRAGRRARVTRPESSGDGAGGGGARKGRGGARKGRGRRRRESEDASSAASDEG